MIRKSMLLAAMAVLAFGQTTRATEPSNGAVQPTSSVLMGTISCNGYLDVPMTKDAEQSLPMQVIGTLECGQEVTILSDPEAYTIYILTKEGKNGYVARMYVKNPVRRHAESAPQPLDGAAVSNGVARWQAGSKGSVQFRSGSEAVESLTANGVTVQVSLQDSGWKMRANVAIVNGAREVVYILPKMVALEEHAPLIRPLRYQDPSQVAKAATHQLLWTSASADPALNSQPQRASVSSGNELTSVSFKLPSADPAPNYLAQHQALEEIAAKSQTAMVDLTREIRELSLRECTLKPGEKTAGAVWFDRDSKSSQMLLRVPVGGMVFEFPLSFSHEK